MATTGKQDSIDKYVLIGRCDCDDNVKFPFYWSEEIIKESKKLGYKVVDLKRENFNEEQFGKHIEEKNVLFVFLNGHGDEVSARGFQKQPVLTLNKNDYLLKGKIAHIISCKTGFLLGQLAVDKGCKGYIGYQGIFSFKNSNPAPSEDLFSNLFMEAVNETSKILLKNQDVKKAYLKTQEIYSKYISECRKIYFNERLNDDERDFMRDVIGALELNKQNQVIII